MTSITLTGVALHVDGRPFGEPITWRLHPGETWALVGPTGAGKSLLARTLAGLVPPLAGAVDYGADGAPAGSSVAYVAFGERPGGPGLFHQARWHASFEESLPTVDAILTVDAIWRRNPYEITDRPLPDPAAFTANRERVIDRLELAPLLGRQLHHLSDGEARRVQIARGLLKAPALLILDDPFTGLDRHFREALRRLIPMLVQDGLQVILVLPDGQELPQVVTHVLVLDRGKVVAQGPKQALLPLLGSRTAPPAPACLCPSGHRDDAPAAPLSEPGARAAEPVIELRGIRVVHEALPILDDITWTVRRGEKWALLGPNGAGKSTLLSLILGDHPQAYANDIALFGRPRGSGESVWEIKRRIGWVAPELQRYHPLHSTAFGVVCSGFFDTLGLYRPGTAEQEAIAGAWMARMGLTVDRSRPYNSLSRGEQRLVLIARALVKDPELLILDEPCQGLDLDHQPRVLEAIDEVAGEPGRTMIYVTHRPSEFPRSLTHLVELRGGRVLRQGPMTSSDRVS